MNKLKSICVFCGSSDGNDALITAQAKKLGVTLAAQKITLVYGAARIGAMGVLAQSVLASGGEVIGVIPQFLKTKEVVHTGLTQLHTTTSMHDRKLKMQELSDGFITIPGGFGTFEELFEVITWQQLGLHGKPIGLLNSNGYYDSLLAMLRTMVAKGFLSKEHLDLLIVDTHINPLLEKMQAFKAPPVPQWLSKHTT